MTTFVSTRPPSLIPSSAMTISENSSSILSTSTASSLPKYFNVPFALQRGYFRCIRYLLQLRYDPNERDNHLRTPLILCAYVESDRWTLSLAQNLLEKGAKIALEDHARRNALHHACALQRLPLIKLYLSCLDFNIDARDCEGNTCLHYAAITGNSEIVDLLMRAADSIGVRLDQCINRAGCSAAVLALKYGHIDCANQITHRDWDEFYVVPRPLSIYEILPSNIDHQKTSNKSKKKHLSKKSSRETARSSFGLLKIIFNDGDKGFSTRLAGLCHKDNQIHLKPKNAYPLEKTQLTMTNETQCSSTEALVNEIQSRHVTGEQRSNISFLQTTTSKFQLSIDDINRLKLNEHDEMKSKSSIPMIYQQMSNSTLNHFEQSSSKLREKSSSHSILHQNPMRPISAKTQRHLQKMKTNGSSDISTFVQSSMLLRSPKSSTVPRQIDLSCPIQEAKGSTSRYNQPEELFGLRPEQLFGGEEHQAKILERRPSIRSNEQKPQQRFQCPSSHRWHQDLNHIIDLYHIQQSPNFRKSAIPPTSSRFDSSLELGNSARNRRMSISKSTGTTTTPSTLNNVSKSSAFSKTSTLASLNLPRRNSVLRSTMKLSNA